MRIKHLYNRALSFHKGELNFLARHSHLWPDCALQAAECFFSDSVKYNQTKEIYFRDHKTKQLKPLLAEIFNVPTPTHFAFYKGFSDFLLQILKSFSDSRSLRILTTDQDLSNLQSALNKQNLILNYQIESINFQPFKSFYSRLNQQLRMNTYDIIFMSECVPDSGSRLLLSEVLSSLTSLKTAGMSKVIFDLSYSFLASPLDLQKYTEHFIFFTHTDFYGQSGKDLGIAHYPKKLWQQIENHSRAKGDESELFNAESLYRLIQFLETLKNNKITYPIIYKTISEQQRLFLNEIQSLNNPLINMNSIVLHDIDYHGSFYAFELTDTILCGEFVRLLALQNIFVEALGSRVVFSFGLNNLGPYDLSLLNVITDELLND